MSQRTRTRIRWQVRSTMIRIEANPAHGTSRCGSRGARAAAWMLLVAGACVLMSGCSTEVTTSDGRPMPPEPKSSPPPPVNAEPNAMALLVGLKPTDSDGNGYPDLLTVQAYLYAKPHPTSLYEPGEFVFELYRQGKSSRTGEPIASWRFSSAEAEAAQSYSRLFERGYTFKLSLHEAGTDRLPLTTANLIGRFEPADGDAPVESTGVRVIQIGRGDTTALAE